MTRSESRSLNFLALLLGGALALSLGLNGLLLAARIEEWPDDVSAEQFLICGREDKFDHPAQITNDLAACIFFIKCAPDKIGNIFLLAFILGEADG